MSIRHKLTLCFSSLVICAIGFLISYITIFQKNSYINNEELSQKQALALVNNNILSQVYNLTSEQVNKVLQIRQNLFNQSIAFKKKVKIQLENIEQKYNVNIELLNQELLNAYIQEYQKNNLPLNYKKDFDLLFNQDTLNSEQDPNFNLLYEQNKQAVFEFLDFLEQEQYILHSFNMDLVVTSDKNIAIWPENGDIFTGLSISHRHLLPTLTSNSNLLLSGYFLSLFNKDIQQIFNHKINLDDQNSLESKAQQQDEYAKYINVDQSFLTKRQQLISQELYKTDSFKQSNFLSILFTLSFKSPFNFAIVRNIDAETEEYNQTELKLKQHLEDYFASLKSSLKGEIFIINKNGSLILSSNEQALFTQAPEELLAFCKQEAFNQFENRKQKGANFTKKFDELDIKEITINEQKYLLSCVYIDPINWYVVNIRPYHEIVEPAISSAQILLLIGLICLLISLIISALISRNLTKSLIKIASKARVISKSNLSDPNVVKEICSSIHIKGKDEIAELGKAMNYMGDSISYNLSMLMSAQAKQNKIEGELNAAREIQMGMLCDKENLPHSDKIEHMALLYAAKEVGGDFYDVLKLDDDHIAYMIGDVSDKGVPAALFMSMTLTLARSCLIQGMSISKTMQFLNERLSQNNPNMMFVTMYIMIVNDKTGHVKACNAGHCLPIIIHTQKQANSASQIQELDQINGPAIGALPGMDFSSYDFYLKSGDLVYLYTDGVNEAQNEKEEFFGVENIHKHLLSFAQQVKQQEINETEENYADSLITKVNQELIAFRKYYQQTDDITMLALYFK